MPPTGPTVARRQLGRTLRRLREAAGVSPEQVEHAGIASRTKLWRIESGQVRVRVPDARALATLYGVDAERAEALVAVAQSTTERGSWQVYGDAVPDWFKLYIGLEATAQRISTFEDTVVPGELQTPDYARALWHGAWPDLDDKAVEPHITLRLERQRVLFDRSPAPHLTVVLGENVVRREVGGPGVLAAQVARLVELDRAETVDIRVLPFSAGAHPATTGAFRILQFGDNGEPDVVYVELEVGAHYLERPADVDRYCRIFHLVSRHAVPIGDFVP